MQPSIVVGALLAGSVLASGARAEVHFVPAEFATIQDALAASADFDVILVSPGTWTGPLDIQGLGVEIRAVEGSAVTILDAQGAAVGVHAGAPGDDSIAHVIRFTMTGAVDGAVADGDGTLVLDQCVVRDNSGVGARGPIDAYSCTFSGNGSHGLEDFDAATGCTFEDNGGWGALALGAVIHNPQMDFCTFLGNGLGGARLSVSGPGPAWPADLRVERCTFVGDKLQLAALTSGGTATSTLRNVTLLGGTVKVLQGSLDVSNCILLSPTPITDLSDGDVSVTWSDLPGAWLPGTGNIDADPLFTDAAAGDWSLAPGSPCINTGNPALIDPDTSTSDMGAFTYAPWTILEGGIAPGGSLPSLLGGMGPLIAGEPMQLKVWPLQPAGVWLVVSTTELDLPFKGGVLVPAVDAVFGPLFPSFPQDQLVAAYWPSGLPTGFSFVAQAWWPNALMPQGWEASKGLRGVQP
ncbi:MAG TPA: right-handed parallel beta-helix repeat-containing protein [Planctomycetota bacterium]|nr:right-handed parallel beta-helix repeat-containing protein [Planctomycetota bacterium]